jgi:hypothetical protein
MIVRDILAAEHPPGNLDFIAVAVPQVRIKPPDLHHLALDIGSPRTLQVPPERTVSEIERTHLGTNNDLISHEKTSEIE